MLAGSKPGAEPHEAIGLVNAGLNEGRAKNQRLGFIVIAAFDDPKFAREALGSLIKNGASEPYPMAIGSKVGVMRVSRRREFLSVTHVVLE